LTLSLLAGSIALFWIWARHELRQANPLIDVRLLARREIALTNVAMAFVGIGAYQITQLLTLLMQQPRSTLIGLGVSATMVGLVKLPANASGVIGSILSGHMAARWDARYAAACGAGGIALAWLFMTFFHWSLTELILGLVLASFALPMLSAAASNIIIAAAPMNRISEATGLSTVIRIGASALGSQLIALTLASSLAAGGAVRYPTSEAFERAFIWITAFSGLAFLITLLLPRAPRLVPAEATS
jgi:MFS family permease